MHNISIIVPVYKVEPYIHCCLDSILSQSFTDFELILVDDGSPDNCGVICDEYAQKDSRIRVIHQPNGGAASAKNAGLRAASGEYLSFVDSDDYLEPFAYELMVREMEKEQVDVVQCCFRNVYVNTSVDRVFLPQRQLFDTVSYLRRFTEDWTCGLLWDKLFRRDLFDGVFFEEGHKIDDEFFTYQGIMNAKTVLHLPDIIYNYRMRGSSVTQTPEAKHQILEDQLDYLQKRRVKVLSRFPELKQDYDYHYLWMMLVIARDPAATESSVSACKRLVKEYFKNNRPCRMEPDMLINLGKLLLLSPSEWIRRQVCPTKETESEYVFFE